MKEQQRLTTQVRAPKVRELRARCEEMLRAKEVIVKKIAAAGQVPGATVTSFASSASPKLNPEQVELAEELVDGETKMIASTLEALQGLTRRAETVQRELAL